MNHQKHLVLITVFLLSVFSLYAQHKDQKVPDAIMQKVYN